MKYIIALIVGWGVCTMALSQPTVINVKSKHALVINADTGEVVFSKNETEVASIASITKLMTVLVTLKAHLDLDEELTITKDDVHMTSGSTINTLPVGTKLTRRELILLTLMASNNRAAAALARTYPSGYDMFISDMNTTAAQLDMVNTKFEDSSGLTSANQSTPRDLTKLLVAVSEYDVVKQFSTQTIYTKELVNKKNKITKVSYGTTNRLLLTDDWKIEVQKTGYTSAAGFCVSMVLTIAEQKFIIVLLNATNKIERASDAVKLKYWIEYQVVPTQQQLTYLNPYKRVSLTKRQIASRKP